MEILNQIPGWLFWAYPLAGVASELLLCVFSGKKFATKTFLRGVLGAPYGVVFALGGIIALIIWFCQDPKNDTKK